MADNKTPENRPSTVKSHPNDSETQINKSMKDVPPNTAPEAKPPHYIVKDGRVVDESTGFIAAQSENNDELNRVAQQMNDDVMKAAQKNA